MLYCAHYSAYFGLAILRLVDTELYNSWWSDVQNGSNGSQISERAQKCKHCKPSEPAALHCKVLADVKSNKRSGNNDALLKFKHKQPDHLNAERQQLAGRFKFSQISPRFWFKALWLDGRLRRLVIVQRSSRFYLKVNEFIKINIQLLKLEDSRWNVENVREDAALRSITSSQQVSFVNILWPKKEWSAIFQELSYTNAR